MHFARGLFRIVAFSSMLAMLASCAPMVDARGHPTSPEDFRQIVIGQSRAEDVTSLLGSPSAQSTFGAPVWYYISARRETVGAYAPEVTDQQVTAIHFNDQQVVTSIETRTKADSQAVKFVKKVTPSEGEDLSLMEELFGNFGRFAAPGRQLNPRDPSR